MTFRAMLESTNIIILSDDMKLFAEEAYEKTLKWLKLQKAEGYNSDHIFHNLELEKQDIFQRKIKHPTYENKNEIRFTITGKPERDLIRFDGGFDAQKLNKIYIYFVSPKQISNFSDDGIKKDFIDRVRHETVHALDPLNNDSIIRREIDVDGQMQDQIKTGNYKQYILFPWEKRANLSIMAERNLENMFLKGWNYLKIKKEIDNWKPKLSHPNFQKEKDYYEDENAWRDYKSFMKKLLDIRIRSKV